MSDTESYSLFLNGTEVRLGITVIPDKSSEKQKLILIAVLVRKFNNFLTTLTNPILAVLGLLFCLGLNLLVRYMTHCVERKGGCRTMWIDCGVPGLEEGQCCGKGMCCGVKNSTCERIAEVFLHILLFLCCLCAKR